MGMGVGVGVRGRGRGGVGVGVGVRVGVGVGAVVGELTGRFDEYPISWLGGWLGLGIGVWVKERCKVGRE